MTLGTKPVRYTSLGIGEPQEIDGEVVDEVLACLSVNDYEVANFMCTPNNLEEFGVGLLYNEGIIDGPADIRSIHISKSNCIEIWVGKSFTPPEKFIVTAGCGGGLTFDDFSKRHSPLSGNLSVTPLQLSTLMKEIQQGAELYQRSRGIHTAGLADGEKVLLQVEDIGRHNCLDKLVGAALLQSIPTEGRILLSSGRISSEMINKARRMGTPVVCSRTSPTSLSVSLADAWNITLVAYLRQNRMRVYCHPERIMGVGEASVPKVNPR